MKKGLQNLSLITAVALTCFGTQAQITDPSPYCAATYDGGEFNVPRIINEVKVGTLVNNSGPNQFAEPHYVFYNNVAAPDLEKGQTYTLTVGSEDGTIQFLSAYIDFNGNNVFDLPSEMILGQSILAAGVSNPAVVQFTVPMDAVAGITRMRVMIYGDDKYTWDQGNTSHLACTAFDGGFIDWGETEDYNVNITGGSSMGISNSDVSPEFRLAPNPATGFLFVTEAMKGADIEVLSVDGRRLLLEQNVTADKIDLSQLPTGTAIVRIVTKEKVVSQPIVIQ